VDQAKEAGIQKIAVVESEKSAIIASSQYRDVLWLASGGANMLTDERCRRLSYYSKQLHGAAIHLFADADEAGRKGFLKATERLQQIAAPVVYHDLFPERDDGWDVADEVLLNKR
jgi:DNA primase